MPEKDTLQSFLMKAEAALKTGDFVTARTNAQNALWKDDKNAQAWFILGTASMHGGDQRSAADHFMKAVEFEPNHRLALHWLPIVLRRVGKAEDSIVYAERAAQLAPDAQDPISNLGHSYLAARRLHPALEAFQKALTLGPERAPLFHSLGLVFVLLGKDQDAGQAFRKAISLEPNTLYSYLSLGQLLLTHDMLTEAEDVARASIRVAPNNPIPHLILARVLTDRGEREEAKKHFKIAMKYDPDASVSYAFWLQEEGLFSESERILHQALERNPRLGSAYYVLARANKISATDDPLLGAMEKALQAGGMKPADQAYLEYGLGKAKNDLGDYGKAMEHYDRGNAINLRVHFAGRPFQKDIQEAHFRRILTEAPVADVEPNPSDRPIFIIGMMRSGTTLLEQILSSHPQIAGAGELRFFLEHGSPSLFQNDGKTIRLGDQFLQLLDRVAGPSTRTVDKMPLNFMWVGLIHRVFPNARFLHIRRNPVDTLLSVYMTPFRSPPHYAFSKRNLVDAYRQYQWIMDEWSAVIPGDRLMHLDYEALVSDREPVIREALEFCGVQWDEACMAHEANERIVSTPSLWQVRQPIYNSSVERWRRYEPWLGELAELMV